MSDLPDPLIPSDVDLRDFPFTPMFRARLFGSSFHARATDAEWRTGVTLWLKSWDQVPAGTLPDDDIDLCRLAELGRDIKAWIKVKNGAMRGWVKCSDGRMHHSVVAEGVLEAWERRCTAKRKGKAGASKRWGASDGISNATANATAIARAMPGDSNRQGQGQGQGEVPDLRSGRASIEPPHFDQRDFNDLNEAVLSRVIVPIVETASNLQPPPTRPPARAAGGDDDPNFAAWWAAYPRKEDKGHARKAWASAVRKADPAAIIAGVKRAQFSPDPKYQPLPATWLNGERWGDAKPAPAHVSNGWDFGVMSEAL